MDRIEIAKIENDRTEKNSVLIVDDESANILALTHILGSEYKIYAETDGQDAFETAQIYLPDVILLDILMPDMNGYEVFELLRSDEKTKNIPVIFVTGLGNHEDEEKGLDLGAADYITKPFSPAIVKLRVRNLIQMLNLINRIKELSETDQLTGIANRRSFDNRLQLEWARAKRERVSVSIVLMDIDQFKRYNDIYGHLQGDVALQEVAAVIKQSLKRSIDFAARWGGEEFIALLPVTDLNGAAEVAETIRQNIKNTIIACDNGQNTSVTMSIGINSCIPANDDSLRHLIAGADQALYTAKQTGRDRICCHKN